MGPRKFLWRLVGGPNTVSNRRHKKTRSVALSVVRGRNSLQETRHATLADLARADAQERSDANFVRKTLPRRIDDLLLTELVLAFDLRLGELLLEVASAIVAKGDEKEAAREAAAAPVKAQLCAEHAVAGLDARLSARSGVAVADAVVAITEDERERLLEGFRAQLSLALASTESRWPRLATVAGARAVRDEATKQIPCLRESWESVLQCKTEITDLYLDNEEMARERHHELAERALSILVDSETPPTLDLSDVDLVAAFLIEILCPIGGIADPASKAAALERLGSLLLPPSHEDDRGPLAEAWSSVADQVLSSVAASNLTSHSSGVTIRSNGSPGSNGHRHHHHHHHHSHHHGHHHHHQHHRGHHHHLHGHSNNRRSPPASTSPSPHAEEGEASAGLIPPPLPLPMSTSALAPMSTTTSTSMSTSSSATASMSMSMAASTSTSASVSASHSLTRVSWEEKVSVAEEKKEDEEEREETEKERKQDEEEKREEERKAEKEPRRLPAVCEGMQHDPPTKIEEPTDPDEQEVVAVDPKPAEATGEADTSLPGSASSGESSESSESSDESEESEESDDNEEEAEAEEECSEGTAHARVEKEERRGSFLELLPQLPDLSLPIGHFPRF